MTENLVDIIKDNSNLIKGQSSTEGWIVLFPPFYDRSMSYTKDDYHNLGKKIDVYNAYFLETLDGIKQEIVDLRIKNFWYYTAIRIGSKHVALCNFPDSPLPTHRSLIDIAGYKRGEKTPTENHLFSLMIDIQQRKKGNFDMLSKFYYDDRSAHHILFQPIKDNITKLNLVLKSIR